MRVPTSNLLLLFFAFAAVGPSLGFVAPRAISLQSRTAVPSLLQSQFQKSTFKPTVHRILTFSDTTLAPPRYAASSETAAASEGDDETKKGGLLNYLRSLDVPLLLYFALWYAGNYYVSFT